MLQWIDSGNALTNAHTAEITPGEYAAFMLRIAGTNGGGGNAAVTDVGQVRLNVNGGDIINVPYNILHVLSNVYYGFPEYTQNVGAGFAFSAILPADLPGGGGIMYLSGQDQAFLHLNFNLGAMGIPPASVQWDLLGIEQDGIHKYWSKLFQETLTPGGAGLIREEFAGRNLMGIFISSTVVDRLRVYVDGRIKVSASWDELRAWTDIQSQVEAAATVVWLDLNLSRSPAEPLGNEVTLEFDASGAGTIDIFTLESQFDASRTSQSRSKLRSLIQQRVIVVQRAGGGDESQVIQEITPIPVEPAPVAM